MERVSRLCFWAGLWSAGTEGWFRACASDSFYYLLSVLNPQTGLLPSVVMWRLQVVLGHLAGQPDPGLALRAAPCFSSFPQASAADVVVVHGRRTAVCKAGRGGFKVRPPGTGAWGETVEGREPSYARWPQGCRRQWECELRSLSLSAVGIASQAHRSFASRYRTPPPTSFCQRS